MRLKKPWHRIFGLLLALLALYLGGCFALARSYLSPLRKVAVAPAGISASALPDGTPVWMTPGLAAGASNAKVLYVLSHGYGGSRATWSEIMTALAALGHEAIAPAMPGHDASKEKVCRFGDREADVASAAAQWARSRFRKPPKVVMVGISMGGATSWLASERDRSVDAVVSDGSFARLDDAIDAYFGAVLPGGRWLLWPVKPMALRMSGIDPKRVQPVQAAEKWQGRPALVIHGAEDRLFPVVFGRQLAEAAKCELWVVADARHAYCIECAFDEYVARLDGIGQSLTGSD